jgi:hypothetical protein
MQKKPEEHLAPHHPSPAPLNRRTVLKALAGTGGALAISTLLPRAWDTPMQQGEAGDVSDSATLRTRVDAGGELHFDETQSTDEPTTNRRESYARSNWRIKMNAVPQEMRLSRSRWTIVNAV